MTKAVRIENVDNGTNYGVIVEVWEKGYPDGEPDRMVIEENLNFPAEMTSQNVYLTDSRYIVVKEKVMTKMPGGTGG